MTELDDIKQRIRADKSRLHAKPRISLDLDTEDVPQIEELVGEDRTGGPTPWGWHRWETLMKCPRYYDLAHNKHWKPKRHSEALDFGSLMHECLALYYEETNAIMGEEDDHKANELYRQFQQEPRWRQLLGKFERSGYEWWEEKANNVHRIMSAYVSHYPIEDDTFLREEVVAIEEYCEVQQPFNYTGRADLVYRSPAGLWIVDHKTSRAMTDDLVSGWGINGQMLGLMHLGRSRWPDEYVLGLVINVIVKTVTPQFRRVQIPAKRDLIEMWIEQMEVWRRMIALYELIGWPPNYSACIHRYGRCPYYWYCESGDVEDYVIDEPDEEEEGEEEPWH